MCSFALPKICNKSWFGNYYTICVLNRELMLNHNSLRLLPYEIGKLFNLHILGLAGNPLQPEILSLYKSGTPHLLTYLLDNLAGKWF